MELTREMMPPWVRTVDAKVVAGTVPGTWTVTFRTQAVPGTLAAFAGTLAVARLDILSALVRLTESDTVTDTFEIVPLDGAPFGPAQGDHLSARAAAVLNGRSDLVSQLGALRRRYPPQTGVPLRVETNTDSSLTTGVNVVCANRPGLLYDITSVLTAHGLRTRSLAVLTFNKQAHDTFRVVDSAGNPPRHSEQLAALRADLTGACAE